jgi:hypothetical protein
MPKLPDGENRRKAGLLLVIRKDAVKFVVKKVRKLARIQHRFLEPA